MPTLTVIAGPNGWGKSTLTRSVDFEGRERLLDADTIARGLNRLNPSSAAIAAGREPGSEFCGRDDFSGRSMAHLIPKAKSRGYEVHLIFIGLDSPERCITRIRNRAARGGHFVPDTDVRRRYARSIANAGQALRSADITKFYDNSGDRARLILVASAGIVVWRAEPLPEWVSL